MGAGADEQDAEWAAGELVGLARAATVGIGGPPGAPNRVVWGSGVLVAPGWVLTCAHVFADQGRTRGLGEREDIGVQIEGQTLRGRVAYFLGDEGPDSRHDPDLALVALRDPPPRQPVAWLGDRDPVLCENAHLFGYQDRAGATAFDAVDSTCRVSGKEGRATLVSDVTLLRNGYSGGPLVDFLRGELVGVVKARQGSTVGMVLPLDELRRLGPEHGRPGAPDLGTEPYHELLRLHDAWHVELQDLDRRTGATWTDVRRRLARQASTWDPLDRLEELDWLSRLAPPSHPRVVERVMPASHDREVGDWPFPLRTWRDGYALLGDRQLEHLNYLRKVVREVELAERRSGAQPSQATQGLADWIRKRRRALDWTERIRIGPMDWLPNSILVEIEPLIGYENQPTYYRWSISNGYGSGEWKPARVGDDWAQLTLDEALGEVRDLLGEVLEQADGDAFPVRLEIAAPMEQLLTPAHTWRTRDGLLGTDREVVLRHSARRGEPDSRWVRHWQRLAAAEHLRARAMGDPDQSFLDGEVPVLCRHRDRPGADAAAVRAVLDDGHAVAVWREHIGAHPDCDPHCAEFKELVGTWIEQHKVSELPWRLKELRSAAHEGHDPGQAWARSLVLLYDDPGNPLP
ncbi:trypsin-like peptidase domain-containing protein [Streptacidiphilus sp. EB129]|uniref:VMAP-C domain-containing protein n=1 Tax=Streptacidiphilus sp. EB129 TaxID=3156262 RepID=UPI003513B7C1